MNKRYSFFIIILVTIFAFVIAQACKKSDGINSGKNILTGKIKTSSIIINTIEDSLYYQFFYNNSGRLEEVNISQSTDSGYVIRYTIEYKTDKVLISDSVLNGAVFYLKPGTDLIDSMIFYDHGLDNGGNKVDRDLSGNIVKVGPARTLSPLSTYYYLDSFVYDGANLRSYKYFFVGAGIGSSVRIEFNYDLTKMKRTDNDLNLLENRVHDLFFLMPVNDLSILGLRLGNAYSNAISSITLNNYTDPVYTYYYHYLYNSSVNYSFDVLMTPSLPGIPRHIENTYYP